MDKPKHLKLEWKRTWSLLPSHSGHQKPEAQQACNTLAVTNLFTYFIVPYSNPKQCELTISWKESFTKGHSLKAMYPSMYAAKNAAQSHYSSTFAEHQFLIHSLAAALKGVRPFLKRPLTTLVPKLYPVSKALNLLK